MRIPWNKGRKGVQVAWNKGLTYVLTKPRSDEWKRKVSIANSGKKRSLEFRLKMSIAAKNRPCNRKGLKLSEETKNKVRTTVNAFYLKHPELTQALIFVKQNRRLHYEMGYT